MTSKPASNTLNLPKWYFGLNTLFIVIGVALVFSYWGIGEFIQGIPPYDYSHLMNSSSVFCYDQATFEFGWPHLYPATFYTTFCGIYQTVPPVLSFLWLVIPLFMALVLAGRRAAVLVFPPLAILLILGQSTWLIIPVYILVAYVVEQGRPLKWWHGFLLAGMIFKPHIAGFGVVWLFYKGYKHTRFWIVAGLTWAILFIPSLIMRPAWILEWLPSGRGFEPVSLGSIAIIPVRLLGLDVSRVVGMDPGAGNQAVVWGFCIITTFILLALLYKCHGTLDVYDWVLVFCFANPLLNDYDLVILLPFIALFPRRLLLSLVAGLAVWVYVLMTGQVQGTLGQFNAVLLITTVLIFDRFYKVRFRESLGLVIQW
jgi:hypothetical protein